MKAPDKIYVPQHNIEVGNIQELNELIVVGSIEYIHKDTLLEWVKYVKNIYEIPVNNHQADELCLAKAKAFQIIIDKLNSI